MSIETEDAAAVAALLAEAFEATAAERDARGGTPKAERDLIRQSGLLALVVPRAYGGQGADWTEVLRVVRRIATADASLAHVLGYHYLGAVTPRLFGTPEQAERAYADVVQNNEFWGNALNPLDPRTTLVEADGGLLLDGSKSFCSGSGDSDRLVVSAQRPDGSGIAAMVIPTRRAGVEVLDDWNNMGQRQTDSGTVRFSRVRVEPWEILGPPGPGGSPFATLRTCITQLILTNVYVGLGLGALQAARGYTTAQTRAWPGSGVESATADPYILRHYGECWVDVQAAEVLADRAADDLERCWQRAEALTAEERGACAVATATAKVAATRAGLKVTSEMFEVMGARATSGSARFDRFWRNARTLTLHDPVDYKLREVGDYVLNGQLPRPGLYS